MDKIVFLKNCSRIEKNKKEKEEKISNIAI